MRLLKLGRRWLNMDNVATVTSQVNANGTTTSLAVRFNNSGRGSDREGYTVTVEDKDDVAELTAWLDVNASQPDPLLALVELLSDDNERTNKETQA